MLPVPGRREQTLQNSKTDLRIVVLGPRSVGKSALTVRFLTKRFIGEYDSSRELTYNFETLIDNNKVAMEILDSTYPVDKLVEKCTWGDVFLLVYSITDEKSFEEALDIKKEILTIRNGFFPTTFIVGNKTDLCRERAVAKEDALQIATELNCCFMECSASENYEEVLNVFHEVYHEAMRRRKDRRMSLSPRPLRKAFNKVFGAKVPPSQARENML